MPKVDKQNKSRSERRKKRKFSGNQWTLRRNNVSHVDFETSVTDSVEAAPVVSLTPHDNSVPPTSSLAPPPPAQSLLPSTVPAPVDTLISVSHSKLSSHTSFGETIDSESIPLSSTPKRYSNDLHQSRNLVIVNWVMARLLLMSGRYLFV